LLLSFIFVLIRKRKSFSLSGFLLSAIVSFMAYMGIRNFPFFGFFALPIMANNFAILKTDFKEKITQKKISFLDEKPEDTFEKIILTSATIIIIVCFLQGFNYLYDRKSAMGIGLMNGVNGSAEFFKENDIKGPIFNNYDIGGYLIYHLYPEYKVFVDNRPEAYPVSFFKEIYVPVQEDNKKWEELDQQYNFNTIFFSWRDYTPWGQNFLLQRIKDENWAPIFVDNYNIIFLKRNNVNKNIIEKYELPKEMFKTVKN
ncbi:MAG: hypothetical protein Q8O66_01895, partial [bacterium]|nr:hypothetical protein [bacterium]